MTDEIVMYFVARKDLNMSPGKLAAQVGHGVQYILTRTLCSQEIEWLTEWKNGSSAKVVLAINSLEKLVELAGTLDTAWIPYARIVDEGRTEVAQKTETLLALTPLPRSIAKPYVGLLPLYR